MSDRRQLPTSVRVITAVGAVLYDFFIHDVLKARSEPAAPDVEVKGRIVQETAGAEAGEPAQAAGQGAAR